MILEKILLWVELLMLVYLVLLNLFYTISLGVAAWIVPKRFKQYQFQKGIVFSKINQQPISIIVPAYNEEKTVVDSIETFLALDFENYEVVVVNDGSLDNTLKILIDKFSFEIVQIEPNNICESKEIRQVYYSHQYPGLVLVDKDNGGKADAQNAGVRIARYPYITIVDADTLLDRGSLRELSLALTVNPEIVAIGGVVRVANGCILKDGEISKVGAPKRYIERFQVIEYLRSFLFGRVSLAAMRALLLISGAFGVYRGDAVSGIRGWNRQAIGEDMDAVIRIWKAKYDSSLPWKVEFISTPISWTQVPSTWHSLGLQRERWQRGLMQVLAEQKRMIFNPRYGSVGMLGIPYFIFYEMIGAVIELLSIPYTIILFSFGFLNLPFMWLFLSAVIIWGWIISVYSILLSEGMRFRYPRWRDLGRLLAACFLENLGYRQIHAWWRIKGFFKYIFIPSTRQSSMKSWTTIQRTEFDKGSDL